MLVPRSDPFPFEAVRDLVGIVRAMYSAGRAAHAGESRLRELRDVAVQLKTAIDLALEHAPGTLAHAAAWLRAEDAARRLGDVIDCTTPLEPTLAAARRRVTAAADPRDDRERARVARRARG